jgi:predicted membrane protein
MTGKYKARASKWAWGFFWLLIPALILANYFGGFVELGVWSIAVGALALLIMFHCIASLSFASLPLPIATLYYIFQVPLELPMISFWTLVLVTIPVIIALHLLLPRRFGSGKFVVMGLDGFDGNKDRKRGRRNGGVGGGSVTQITEGDDDNNPRISVSFGGASRYLHSDCLETAELNCSFGGLEVYFDHVQLSPNGAEVYVNCSFGAVEMYVPSDWRVIDEMSASLGGVDVNKHLLSAAPDAPTLTVTGNVSFGGVEVKRIKGD